ncbi:hypothetical protein BGZ65_009439, partial [Modicella reniformis]
MLFRGIVPWTKYDLQVKQTLELTNIYLENAFKTKDNSVALVLCHDAEAVLHHARSTIKKDIIQPRDSEHQALREGLIDAYITLGEFLERQGYRDEAQAIYKKADKLGLNVGGRPSRSSRSNSLVDSFKGSLDSAMDTVTCSPHPFGSQNRQRCDIAIVSPRIFAENVGLPDMELKLPEADERLTNTAQLVFCLSLLQGFHLINETLEPVAFKWLHVTEKDKDEQERLEMLAVDVIRAFKRDELKDSRAVAEVVCLAPVLNKNTFRDLLK